MKVNQNILDEIKIKIYLVCKFKKIFFRYTLFIKNQQKWTVHNLLLIFTC